jgi:hypothetical protein
MEWDNPLRYALAIVIAKSGYSINRLSSEDVLTKALEALDGSMLRNGLFPGQIDDGTHEESFFVNKYYRDFYFHVGFEVPYVLWEFRAGNNLPRSDSGSSTLQAPLQTKPKRQLSLTITEVPSSSPNDVGIRIEEPEGVTSTFAPREPPLMKGKIPFNNFIDSQNIVDVPEEWLYDYPSFVDFEPHSSQFTRQSLGNFKFEVGEVVWNAITAFQERGDKPETQEEYAPAAALPDDSRNKWGPPWLRRSGNLVRDVAKKKNSRKGFCQCR